MNVVEADDGDIFGNGEAGLTQGTNGSHGRDVIEGEEGRERLGRSEQRLCGFISELWRWGVALELNDKVGIDGQAKIAGDLFDAGPTHLGVGAEFLAFDKGDLAMAEMEEVFESDLSGSLVVEDNVGDAIDVVVTRDGDYGNGKIEVPWSVGGNEAIDGTLEEHAGIFVDKIRAVAMASNEIKVTFLQEIIFDAAHDRGRVTIADLGYDDTNGKAALRAQGTGKEVGAVFEFASGGEDAIFGLLGNGIGDVGAINDQGDGCGRKAEVLGQLLEADRSLSGAAR